MKRIIYFVLCIFTCMTLLTACGSSDEPVDETTKAESDVSTISPEDSDDAIDNNHNNEDEAVEVPVTDVTPSTEDTTEADTTESDVDTSTTDDDDLTDAQDNVAKNPTEEFHATGTFNGFIDSSSVEITMSDGSYQTFFVYEEAAVNKLQQLMESETPPTIQFVYRAREGQINPEIISVN